MLRKFHLISADKKLTHDLIELAGSLVATSETAGVSAVPKGRDRFFEPK